MSSYGVQKHSALYLVLRLRGGVQTLAELADAVAAAHRQGLPEGKCLVCSAEAKRGRWCDRLHFGTDAHRTSMAWAQRQLDNGCLNSTWCAPCGQTAAATVSGPTSSSAMSSSASPLASTTSEQQLRVGGRIAWIKVFRPIGCAADVHVDGAFVVGSFFYSGGKFGKKT